MFDPLYEKLIPIQPEAMQSTYSKWTEKGFDLNAALDQINGPVIEIGGPTYQGYQNIFPESEFANRLPNGYRILVSNKDYWRPKLQEDPFGDLQFDPKNMPPIEPPPGAILKQDLDFVCDGEFMPFQDRCIGAVLFSYLDVFLRKGVIEEAARVLEPGGILIVQTLSETDIEHAKEQGLVPKIVYTSNKAFRKGRNLQKLHDAVFMKET